MAFGAKAEIVERFTSVKPSPVGMRVDEHKKNINKVPDKQTTLTENSIQKVHLFDSSNPKIQADKCHCNKPLAIENVSHSW